ncbi:MAG: 3'-5' exonuclease, partial [Bacteroidales bacterium]|uniref:ATP-dependent helicase n=1 Tax=Porphyromonas sp. TaxID=1924944 RepID=UPI0029711B71
LFEAFNAPMEAQQVAAQINKLISDGVDPEEIAILYRTNAQSRLLEQNLKMFGIPNRIYGGLSFFDRKEVKDVLAYLRLVINPLDDEAFRRVYNTPARGIGATTFEGLAEIANREQLPFMALIRQPEKLTSTMKGSGIGKLQAFGELIEVLTNLTEELQPIPYLQKLIELSGLKTLYNDGTVEGQSRIDNIAELVSALNDFINRRKEETGEEPTLEEFVREMTLYTDQDTEEDGTSKVTMMTMHASKGLEFAHIFCVGLEEGLIPNMRSSSQAEIEEERRLFYVAITRAKEHCTLCYARERMTNGQPNISSPSRFLHDLDPQYIKDNTGILTSKVQEKIKEKVKAMHQDLPSPTRRITRIRRDRQVGSDGISRGHDEKLASAVPQADFREGDFVYHNNFGRGEVLGFSDSVSGTKASIKFQDGQVRQLILKFAKLRKE